MTTSRPSLPIALATLFAFGATAGLAADMTLGQYEYENSCAQCHGADGQGDGQIARYLVDPPPSLTTLRKENGGVFPVSRVYEVIDGTADIGVHGRDMPVWGDRFRTRARADEGLPMMPIEPETYARTRILALIDYLATLQVD